MNYWPHRAADNKKNIEEHITFSLISQINWAKISDKEPETKKLIWMRMAKPTSFVQ